MSERYLEDFSVGQKFGSGHLRVDADRIKSFASEFDPQPFHLDEDAARRSIFQGLAASGWHTAALSMRLWSTASSSPRAASWGRASTSFAGPAPCDPEMSFASRARYSRCA